MNKLKYIITILFFTACSNPPEKSIDNFLIFKHGKVAGGEYLSKVIQEFHEKNPDVKVKEEILPATTDQQHQFYVTNLEGKSEDFDVFALDVIWTPEFSRAGWLLDLSEYFSEKELSVFIKAPLKANTYKNRIYAIPWYVDAGLLYYRKDLLDKYGFEPPDTFGELVEISKIILEKENNPNLYGFIWQGKQYEGLICNAIEYIYGNGGSIIQNNVLTLNEQKTIEALKFMRDLIYKYKISPKLVTTANEEMTRHIFGNGKAIFLRNWTYAWNIFQRDDSAIKGKVGITVIPHFYANESVATLGGWQLGINKFSKKKNSAIKFIKYLTSYEIQKFITVNVGLKPTRIDLYYDEELKEKQPFITSLIDIFQKAIPRPVTPLYLMMSQTLQSEFSAIINEIKEPEKALADADEQINYILKNSE